MSGWVYLFACVSFACSQGVVAVQGDGKYYETERVCRAAAQNDPYWPIAYKQGREIVCALRNKPR